MAHEEDDDLYDEEFDFVDDDDDDSEVDEADDDATDTEEVSAEGSDIADEPLDDREDRADDREPEVAEQDDEPVDEYGRPEQPPANYVVHVYESKKFHRTIDRPFTPEDAEAFATEFNRTSKNYGRFAITGKIDAKPKKTLD
jgi:hypothetical protein